MQYPESKMEVAVHIENGLVKVYGYEDDGFRPFIRSVKLDSKPSAINYCANYNEIQRRSIGLGHR